MRIADVRTAMWTPVMAALAVALVPGLPAEN